MSTQGVYRTANATVSAHGAQAVTASDSTELPCTRALYVGTGGNVSVIMGDGQNGSAVTFSNVPTGVILPIQVVKVMAATTASNILALY